ncbi:MAG: methylated-DNA--[protein]-cysteine S-methyltransferase [Rickettsiales bacterium]
MSDILYYKFYDSPVGKLQIISSDRELVAIYPRRFFRNDEDNFRENSEHPILLKTEKQLDEYFLGQRKEFDLPLDMRGTVFQIKSWRQLQKIPYGGTVSYGQQAKGMGDAKKARAVGMANGRNPLLIVVPCHRVIGKDGSLTGFGGGLDMKKKLLELEQAHI